VANGVSGGLGAVGAAGLGEDVPDMRGNCTEADRQHGRDVSIAAADRDQAKHLGLARGQVVGRARARQFIETLGDAFLKRAHADLARTLEA